MLWVKYSAMLSRQKKKQKPQQLFYLISHECLSDAFPLWQLLLHTHTHAHAHGLCTQNNRSLPKQREASLDVYSASDSDAALWQSRVDMCLAVYHMEPGEGSGRLPPTIVWDSKWLSNTAEPRHCKGISPLCFLKQFGIKGWKKKMLCVCVCAHVCVWVCARDWSAVGWKKKKEKGLSHARNHISYI